MAGGNGQPRRHPLECAPERGTCVAITQSMRLQSITAEQLGLVTGGADLPPSVINPTSCSSSNPSGKPIYTQSMETDHSGPSMSQRVEQAYDKAMAPWRAFNSLGGSVAAMSRGAR